MAEVKKLLQCVKSLRIHDKPLAEIEKIEQNQVNVDLYSVYKFSHARSASQFHSIK